MTEDTPSAYTCISKEYMFLISSSSLDTLFFAIVPTKQRNNLTQYRCLSVSVHLAVLALVLVHRPTADRQRSRHKRHVVFDCNNQWPTLDESKQCLCGKFYASPPVAKSTTIVPVAVCDEPKQTEKEILTPFSCSKWTGDDCHVHNTVTQVSLWN